MPGHVIMQEYINHLTDLQTLSLDHDDKSNKTKVKCKES